MLKEGVKAETVEAPLPKPIELRSYRFQEEREPAWKELESLLDRIEQHGPRELSAAELMQLPHLYRTVLSSLSIARHYVVDDRLLAYLEALATRAHLALHEPSETVGEFLKRLFTEDLPYLVRRLGRLLLITTILILLGALLTRQLVIERPDLFLALTDNPLSNTVLIGTSDSPTVPKDPEALLERIEPSQELILGDATRDFLRIVKNNAIFVLVAFGLGAALGAPTLVMMFYFGVTIGSEAAQYANLGDGAEARFFVWWSVSGPLEFAAVSLAGAAGLAMAEAMLFPPPRINRFAMAQVAGRDAGKIALVAVLLVFVAAFLEAFIQPVLVPELVRIALGLTMLAFPIAYVIWPREESHV